jgi:hypothetical protein
MLAGLIPGIREIRAPLAAGYLWLFALWLALKPSLPSKDEATGVVADVIDLADAATPVAVAVAVSFAAYLIGSISDIVLRAGRSVWTEWAERLPDAIRVLATRHDYGRGMSTLRASNRGYDSLDSAAVERVREVESRLAGKNRTLEDLPPDLIKPISEFDAYTRAEGGGPAPETLARYALINRTFDELPVIATRLMGEQPELFSAVDRLRSEADLRRSVVPPLVALIAVLVVRSHWAWIFGLIVVVLIAYQGRQREQEAGDLVIDSIFIGRVEPPAFERLRRAAENLPEPQAPTWQ